MKKFLFLFSFIALLCLPWVGRAQTIVDFESGDLSGLSAVSTSVTNDATYPWVVTSNAPAGFNGTYCMKSSNSGVASSSSTIEITVTFTGNGSISFLGGCWGEGSYTAWDKCIFSIDGVQQFANGALAAWGFYTYEITAGTHTFTWSYTKDSSVNPTNDAFYVDDITFELGNNPCAKPTELAYSNVEAHSAMLSWNANGTSSWQICLNGDEENLIDATSNPYTLNGLLSEAPYTVKVRANCGSDGYSYWSSPVSFTTSIACAKPTNLTASFTPGNGSIATLSWTPADANASWVLQYGTDNTFAAGTYVEETVSGTPSIDLTGLTAETTYYARVSAICDNSESSQWSSVCSFTPTDAYRIGSGTATNYYLPSYNYYNYGFSQQIYTAEEIGTSGIISSIAFYNAGALKSRTYDIYLVNTPKTAFDSTKDWIAVTADDLVYTGEVTMTPGEWTTISFTNEFVYDASYNLAVIVDDNTSSYSFSPHMECLVFPGTSSSLYACSDGTDYMPYNPGSHTGTIGNIKNQILLGITPSGGSVCLRPTNLAVTNITGHTADLSWNPTGDATAWQICLNNDETNLIDVTGTTYSFTGLNPETTYTVKMRTNCDDGFSSWTSVVTFTTDVACPAPTGVAVSNVTGHTADLSWNAGDATAWQICLNDDETNLIDVTVNQYAITGLDPVTSYTVKVRSNCGEEGYSAWATKTFTTDVACPAPTALNAEIIGTTANLTWNGSADSYVVKYRTAAYALTSFFEDFENGLSNWTIYTEGESPQANGWRTFNPIISFDEPVYPVSGNYVASAWSWSSVAYDADNWLVSPQIQLDGNLKFWVMTNGGYPDHYSVLLSTTGNAIADFTTTLQAYGAAPGTWTQVNIDLSAYAGQVGYIALHHVDEDANYLFIDDFGLYGDEVPAGEWVSQLVEGNSLTISGLNPETAYEWTIQGNCTGEEAPSAWSSSTFTTDVACPAPASLAAENITGRTADLSWNGISDSYTIQYRVAGEDPAAEWMTATATSNTLTLTALLPETDYEWQVQGTCDEETSAWSNMSTFTTDELNCLAPTNLSYEEGSITAHGVTLNWTDLNFEAAAWQICINNDEENLLNATVNNYIITDLTPNTPYTVKVRTICDTILSSDWSSILTFTTLEEIIPSYVTITGDTLVCPEATTTLTATTDVEATFEWEFGADEAQVVVPAGTYTVTVTSTTGNQLSASITVTTLPTYNVTDEITICESELPYDYHGTYINAAGEYPNIVLQTVNGCDSVVNLTLVVNPVYTVPDEMTICSSQLPYEWNGITFTEAGNDTATLHTVNGCDSIVTMTLIVKESYTATDSKTICASLLPYEWNGVTFNEAGTQDVTLEAVNGCDSVVTMTLVVNPTYAISEERTVCTSALPYTWNGVAFNEAGTQTVTLQTANGCDSVVTMIVAVSTAYEVTDTKIICESALPYTWNEVVFNEAGTQAVTMQSSNGCDSIITMNLIVNPIYNVTDEATICASALPYEWNGVTFTEAGTQVATLQTVNGCDSVVTMTLTVNPIYNVTDEATICASALPYEWNGVTFTEAGTLTATLQTVDGCDSVVVMTLTVNPIYNVTDEATICASALPYEWNGVTFTEAGTQAATLQTVNNCDSVVTMTLTVNPIFNVTDEATICASALPYEWNGVTFTEAGTQVATLQTVNGCDSVVTMTLTVNPTYNVTDAATICANLLPYTWNGITFTEAGTQVATLQTVNGCDSVVTMTLTVNALPTVTITGETAICQGESTTLTAAGATTYAWSTEATTAAINVNQAGTYTVIGTDANGCQNTANVTVVMNMPTSSTDVQVACDNYTWIDGVTYTTSTNTPTFTLTNAAGCDSVVTLNLTINYSSNSQDLRTICASELPYTWNGVAFTEAGTQIATLTNVAGCDSVVTMTLVVNPTYNETAAATICSSELPYEWNGLTFTEAGTQTLTLQTVNGCDSIIVMTLTVNMVDATEFTEAACEQYEWNGVNYTESGDYTQTFTNAAGCDSTVTLHLTINHNETSEFTIETNEGCYTWNGTEYCQSGDYTQTFETVAGCDSIVTLHLSVGVGIENHEVLIVKIAPNPASNTCRIIGLDTDPVSVDLYDMNGKLVRRVNDTEFDVSTLPTGIYMVRVYTGEQIVNLKLVKE